MVKKAAGYEIQTAKIVSGTDIAQRYLNTWFLWVDCRNQCFAATTSAVSCGFHHPLSHKCSLSCTQGLTKPNLFNHFRLLLFLIALFKIEKLLELQIYQLLVSFLSIHLKRKKIMSFQLCMIFIICIFCLDLQLQWRMTETLVSVQL